MDAPAVTLRDQARPTCNEHREEDTSSTIDIAESLTRRSSLARVLPGCRPCGLNWDECILEPTVEAAEILTVRVQLDKLPVWVIRLNKKDGLVRCNLQELEILRWIAEGQAQNIDFNPAVEYVPQRRYPCIFPHQAGEAHDVLEIIPGMTPEELHEIGEEASQHRSVLLCPVPAPNCVQNSLHRGVSKEVHQLATRWPLRQIISSPSEEGILDISPVVICRNSSTPLNSQCAVFAQQPKQGTFNADLPAEIRSSISLQDVGATPEYVNRKGRNNPNIALHSSWHNDILGVAQRAVLKCQYRSATVLPTKLYDATSRIVRTKDYMSGTEAEPLHFLALSYCWEEWPEDVSLKNHLFELSQRLGVRYFWVDRLCVNQNDAKDKAREVPRMRDYYQGASGCIVLTGPDVKPFKCVPQHSGAILSSFQQILLNKEAIESLASCKWVTRVWTLQEALLSRQLIYVVQKQLIDGDFISELVAYLTTGSESVSRETDEWFGGYGCYRWNGRTPSVVSPRQFRMDETPGKLVIIRSIFGGQQQFNELQRAGHGRVLVPFEEALALCTNRSATEREDIIYGILGVSEGGEKVGVEYGNICWRTMLDRLGRVGMLTERLLASPTVNKRPGLSWLPESGAGYGPFLHGEPLAAAVERPVLAWPEKELVVTGIRFEWSGAKCEEDKFINIHGLPCCLVRGEISFPDVPGLRASVGGTSQVLFTPERLKGTHVMLCEGIDKNTEDTVAMRVNGNIESGRIYREDGYVLELYRWLQGDPASLQGKRWTFGNES
ncbi:hypothetical protein ANO14919_136360 [Xylariales sp. No.14919]|nr:hypothetical protein ANO14919_136360 [Xylariales sp. No.14919]